MLDLIQWFKKMTSKIRQDNVSAFAAQSAYFTILSFFPFIMFLLTLLRFLPIEDSALIETIIKLVPSSAANTITWFLSEILKKSTGTLMSFTIIILLWTAGKGIMALTRGLNAINGIPETRNYIVLRIVSTIYTLLFAIMIIFTLGILVFGNWFYALITSYIPMLNEIAAFVINIRSITGFLLMVILFSFFYKVLPAKKMKLYQQIPGALFSAAGWLLCSYIFSVYVDFSSGISYIYGSLSSIVFLMLWLYFCMYIVFLGAELNMLIYGEKKVTKGLLY